MTRKCYFSYSISRFSICMQTQMCIQNACSQSDDGKLLGLVWHIGFETKVRILKVFSNLKMYLCMCMRNQSICFATIVFCLVNIRCLFCEECWMYSENINKFLLKIEYISHVRFWTSPRFTKTRPLRQKNAN